MSNKKPLLQILLRQVKALVNESCDCITNERERPIKAEQYIGGEMAKIEAQAFIKRLKPLLDEVDALSKGD